MLLPNIETLVHSRIANTSIIALMKLYGIPIIVYEPEEDSRTSTYGNYSGPVYNPEFRDTNLILLGDAYQQVLGTSNDIGIFEDIRCIVDRELRVASAIQIDRSDGKEVHFIVEEPLQYGVTLTTFFFYRLSHFVR